MTAPMKSSLDTAKAQQVWAEYQNQHDVSALKGKAVGIDPDTGEVFFGDSALDIAHTLEVQGKRRPLFFLRVGFSYYQRKGRRR